MSYEKFAYLYDELMSDAPYDKWVSFVMKVMEECNVKQGKILDVGCGTGNISIPLSQKGYEITAVDLSEEMLIVAKEKSEMANTSIKFFQQDMRELEGLGSFDTIISLCDSINYLNNEKEVEKTFEGVYNHLNDQGIFIFDVHSIYKIESIFKGNTFAYNGEQISYIWECFESEESYSIEHDLSFFVENKQGLYERFDEIHKQRTYPVSFYQEALEKIGFKVMMISGDFSFETLNDNDHRWFFVAKK
ncbi:SAM-dependent methyltransferase [Anaerobacillus alkalidiazotrophicus]|uniref:SAM-dependent methyltransferase n=1 Tax=Anaerobacillus alkalidiazotrophicus TaxID=472963 RepID=A0A1S2MEJ3_9BACI|nr:class I SAM-dependent methyltransferase [Anaerobacillus alkalidiazotrophicus]OIJ22105.1 SAM-dependent methyltransferase [Anaerobacillus alkalidiazotrophicus]